MEQRTRSYLATLSGSLRAAGNAATADVIDQVSVEYERRHWYELSLQLLRAIQDPAVLEGAYELHESVLMTIRADIPPIAYVKLVYCVCFSPKSTTERALELIAGASASLLSQGSTQGPHAVQCIRALLLLSGISSEDRALTTTPGSAPHTARKILEETEAYSLTLQMHEVEPVLVALLAKARGRDYELRKQFTKFYKNAFDIVTYMGKAEMPVMEAELGVLAFKTVLAALLSEEIFNFGKLLNFKPFVDTLANSEEHRWMLDWIKLCNDGDVHRFETFASTHGAQIAAIPDLTEAMPALRKKVRLMALLHLVFYKPLDERVLPFNVVATRCNVAEDETEPLLLSALAQGIVKGKIDGLGRKVNISWVEPRVLSLEEVVKLAQHVGKWRQQINGVSEFVGKMAEQIPK